MLFSTVAAPIYIPTNSVGDNLLISTIGLPSAFALLLGVWLMLCESVYGNFCPAWAHITSRIELAYLTTKSKKWNLKAQRLEGRSCSSHQRQLHDSKWLMTQGFTTRHNHPLLIIDQGWKHPNQLPLSFSYILLVCLCTCVCMCIWKRERHREREQGENHILRVL